MFWKISLFALAMLSLAALAEATVIYVSGDQTGTWSADTAIVTAEVRVPPGQSLTILPGVEVLFSVYCKLIVNNGATLRAVGTPADSIRFDVLPPNTTWHGIRFLSASDSSRLEYCHLTHGSATGGGEDSKGGGIYCSNSSPTISGNALSRNSATFDGGGIYCAYSNATISGNTISTNSANHYGGGIYCAGNSSLNISGNTIGGNTARYLGGGIYCSYCNPTISGNTISANSAEMGGGILCSDSSPTISGNTISGNESSYSGAGIHCDKASPTIIGNTISANSVDWMGGAIYCYCSNSTIIGNTICRNESYYGSGGGIYFDQSSAYPFEFNEITLNNASGNGGGIYLQWSIPIMNKNTVAGNTAALGGGLYSTSSDPLLSNCIFWGNVPPQIYQTATSNVRVGYSDIQGGYAGTGNINADPLFVNAAQDDYRLQWDSPCIDTGDPNPIHNDPDGTRADMGAWYYDQSLPVRILLTPYNAPIQIPASGGSFQYAIQATNIADSTLITSLWCNLTLPNGTTFGPVLGPVRISLGSGQTISRVRTQNISAHAPAGMYHYNAYAAAAGDTSEDNFVFTKLAAGDWGLGDGGWTNTGEEFAGEMPSMASIHPSSFILHPCVPNPFNPTTVASFELRVSSYISLRIYDTAGRLVATLADGWRDAGNHQITFDGSGLPSGIYIAKLTAGDYSQVQKMILMK